MPGNKEQTGGGRARRCWRSGAGAGSALGAAPGAPRRTRGTRAAPGAPRAATSQPPLPGPGSSAPPGAEPRPGPRRREPGPSRAGTGAAPGSAAGRSRADPAGPARGSGSPGHTPDGHTDGRADTQTAPCRHTPGPSRAPHTRGARAGAADRDRDRDRDRYRARVAPSPPCRPEPPLANLPPPSPGSLCGPGRAGPCRGCPGPGLGGDKAGAAAAAALTYIGVAESLLRVDGRAAAAVGRGGPGEQQHRQPGQQAGQRGGHGAGGCGLSDPADKASSTAGPGRAAADRRRSSGPPPPPLPGPSPLSAASPRSWRLPPAAAEPRVLMRSGAPLLLLCMARGQPGCAQLPPLRGMRLRAQLAPPSAPPPRPAPGTGHPQPPDPRPAAHRPPPRFHRPGPGRGRAAAAEGQRRGPGCPPGGAGTGTGRGWGWGRSRALLAELAPSPQAGAVVMSVPKHFLSCRLLRLISPPLCSPCFLPPLLLPPPPLGGHSWPMTITGGPTWLRGARSPPAPSPWPTALRPGAHPQNPPAHPCPGCRRCWGAAGPPVPILQGPALPQAGLCRPQHGQAGHRGHTGWPALRPHSLLPGQPLATEPGHDCPWLKEVSEPLVL